MAQDYDLMTHDLSVSMERIADRLVSVDRWLKIAAVGILVTAAAVVADILLH